MKGYKSVGLPKQKPLHEVRSCERSYLKHRETYMQKQQNNKQMKCPFESVNLK